MYDVIIIGAGPAGISASLYAKRTGANVLVLYNGESSLDNAANIDNYYGFPDGISGKELYENGIKQAVNLGIDVNHEEVLSIQKEEDIFTVKTLSTSNAEDKNITEEKIYTSKAVIIATGNKKIKPNIKGIEEFEGKGISYCAICDGFFYRGKNVAVIGNGNYAINEAKDLKNIVNSVIILTNGEKNNLTTKFEINDKKIKEIHGTEKVSNIEFEDGSILEIDGIFIAEGEAGTTDFAKKIGAILDKNNIVVNEKMQTNIQGLYSCGNSTGGLLQICKAVYEGAIAGLNAANDIKNI